MFDTDDDEMNKQQKIVLRKMYFSGTGSSQKLLVLRRSFHRQFMKRRVESKIEQLINIFIDEKITIRLLLLVTRAFDCAHRRLIIESWNLNEYLFARLTVK